MPPPFLLVVLLDCFLTLIDPCAHSQDAQIEKEKQVYSVTGGCTALAVVYLLGKLYVANAGDSRCVSARVQNALKRYKMSRGRPLCEQGHHH